MLKFNHGVFQIVHVAKSGGMQMISNGQQCSDLPSLYRRIGFIQRPTFKVIHTIQGYRCVGQCVAMDPKYIYLVECTLNTLSIYFSLTFRSHATKPHKLHGCPPHHIIHTTLIEKKINHPKQDLPVFCSCDVVPCTYLLVVQWQ